MFDGGEVQIVWKHCRVIVDTSLNTGVELEMMFSPPGMT